MLAVIDGVVAGGIISIALAALEVAKRALAKKDGSNGNGRGGFNADDRRALTKALAVLVDVSKVLSQLDEDGSPLTYTPRSLVRTINRQTDILERLSLSHSGLATHVRDHETREEQVLVEIRDALRSQP